MLLAVALTGLVFLLLVAATSVAYLVLPGGRFCPRCGGATHPVRLRRPFRLLRRILQWRWCADCGWEGLGRPPRRPRPGERFEWRRPDPRRSPVFRWWDDEEPAEPAPDAGKPGGGRAGPDGKPRSPEARHDPAAPPPAAPPAGFRWRNPDRRSGPAFHWGGSPEGVEGGKPSDDGVLVRFLRWLRNDDPGFRWRDPEG